MAEDARLRFEDYGAAIGAAATVLRANATSSALTAAVPTCPGWSVADLVVHVGMVHRWAADLLSGVQGDGSDHAAAGRAAEDLLDWFDDGATALLDVLSKTPPDWDGFFFLKNSPDKRLGWTRRQAHETTIHAVDAMSARLGRVPNERELWFTPDLAVDGIDELLMGFAPRRSSQLRTPEPTILEITTADGGESSAAWTIELSDNPPQVRRGTARDHDLDADVTWSGPARDVYLTLWNRTDRKGTDDGADRIHIEARTDRGARVRDLWTDLFTVEWA